MECRGMVFLSTELSIAYVFITQFFAARCSFFEEFKIDRSCADGSSSSLYPCTSSPFSISKIQSWKRQFVSPIIWTWGTNHGTAPKRTHSSSALRKGLVGFSKGAIYEYSPHDQ